MQPQQPYGYQQPQPQQQYQQPPQQAPYPNPYGQQYQQAQPYPYGQPRPQWWGAPAGEPSGITTLAAAVLALLIGLTWIVAVAVPLFTVDTVEMTGVLVMSGIAFVLSAPSLVGGVGLFARRGFGRWFLVVGLVLSMLPSGFVVVASFLESPGPPQWLLLSAVSILVFSIAGIVLAVSPTTGRHLRAAKQSRQPGYPAQQMYGYPQQAYPQQVYPQQAMPQQGYPPQYPQQGYPQQPGPPPRY